ncbi:serine/arginine repetitive matrix protein 1 [Zerene cesonia]|uniref:serine/arginine repetitive matrix protein 1 n=1 Tax=Zerene cesonia TaxID=33412 RepID=UPI0018E54117|nr:serine/arginine repetitive matrix protein 1 [Zerene cesonia]
MIGSFWNLCRACPSMPVDKLHSEYRSTYRWHEYKEQQNQQQGVVKQPAPTPPSALPIARGAIEPAMPRRKKYPGVAYKTNELFDPAPSDDIRPQTLDRARSAQRNETDRAGRRSKSEGPRQPRWTDTVEPKATTALGEVLAAKEPETVSTEYRNQFAWPKDTTDAPRKSISMGALKKAAAAEGSVEAEPLMNHVDGEEDHKRYIEDYLWNGQKPGVQRYVQTHIAGGAGEDTASTLRAAGLQPLGLAQGDSWYREVLDLRKRAGEYKYRGWGTELAPDHITQLYNKQIELWYQVSRRSSLSALSLASTNHKALPRDEKDGKESKSHSPKKFRSFRSAPHQSIHAKLQETKALERSPHKTSPQKQRKKLQGHSFDEGAAQEGAKTEGAFRSPRRRPRSADPAPAPARHPPNGHEPHPRPAKPTGLPLSRGSSNRVRSSSRGGRSPSAPPKTGPGANGAVEVNGTIERGKRSRSTSKVGIKIDDEIPSHRSASVAKDHFFDDSPVVKSPPEPTRVKSPEQMNMRSPDPVNWTVPLDTGKTFTVTQNVKSDESVKRPSSEFKGGSVAEDGAAKPAEIAPIHHQQMSPIRSLKKSESPTSLSKRVDKTPTTPTSLTPIDETKALDLNKVNGINGVNSNQLTPETPVKETIKEKEVIKKSTEATQVAPGVVDTTLVNDNAGSGGLTAAEVLDRARSRFDKFWGKKEDDV